MLSTRVWARDSHIYSTAKDGNTRGRLILSLALRFLVSFEFPYFAHMMQDNTQLTRQQDI